MEKVRLTNIKYFASILSGMIIGIIIGAFIIIALVSYRIDKYYEQIQKLNVSIEERDERLKKLDQSINRKKLILKDINIILTYEGDQIDKIDIEKYAENKYNKLLGREVETIDADIIEDIIDNRIFKVGNKEYQLEVTKVVLTDILKIWISIESIE